MVLGLHGIPTLHASTVVTPRGVCAFLGPAGAGKSTLAASFASVGYPALGDDCLAIKEDRGFFAIPAYPGLRLWTDSAESLSTDWSSAPTVAHYTRKRRILNAPAAERFPTRPVRLAVIYCIAREASGDGPGGEPAIEPLRPNEVFLQLLSASFMLDITDRSVLTRNLRFIERMLNAVPVRRLRIPDGFSSLPKGGWLWRRRRRRELHRIRLQIRSGAEPRSSAADLLREFGCNARAHGTPPRVDR
jgi:hypothetical protein